MNSTKTAKACCKLNPNSLFNASYMISDYFSIVQCKNKCNFDFEKENSQKKIKIHFRTVTDFIKELFPAAIASAYKLFKIFPLNRRKVIFRSSKGGKYNCCPKYICEYLLKNCPDDFKLVWIFNEPENYSYLKEKGIKLCRSNSLSALYNLATSAFVFDNHGIYSYFTKRKNQYVFNTWHGGGAYKKGFKNHADSKTAYTAKMKKNTDYLIASCEKFAKCSLFFDSPEKILPFGMARSDVFFSDTSELRKKVFSFYGLNENDKLILYAPTYRYYENDTFYGLDCEGVIAACERRFGGNFVFAFKLHEFIENNKTDIDRDKYVCANDYEDTQELIAAADVIITDYSSLIWDAALAKIPCFIFATDLEQFCGERDFHTPIEEWPFSLAKTNSELAENIIAFEEAAYDKACASHLEALGSYETGISAKQTVQLMKALNEKSV